MKQREQQTVQLATRLALRCRVAIYATHNRHGAASLRQKEKKADVWEQRVACMSWCMGCSDNMKTEVGGSEGGCVGTLYAVHASFVLSCLPVSCSSVSRCLSVGHLSGADSS